jgi:adenylate cyclase
VTSYLPIGWFFLLLFPFASFCQTGDTLSLLVQLDSARSEKERILIIEALSEAHARNHPAKALDYGLQGLALSKELGHEILIARAKAQLGEVYWQQGNYDASLGMAHQALATFETYEDSLGIARALTLWAKVGYRYGKYVQGLEYLMQGLEIREHYEVLAAQGESWLWMGIIRAEIGHYPVARECYEQALEIARQTDDSLMMADVLNHIARSWRKEENYPEAVHYQELSKAIYEALGDKLGLSDYYNNMGSILRRQKKYGEALAHFFQALALQQELQDQEGLADSYNDIGTTLLQQGKAEEALVYLKQGLAIAQAIGLKDDVRYAYSSLAQAYEKMNNYAAAVETYKRFNGIKDSLFNQEAQQQIAEIGFRYERERVREQLKLAKTQAELDAQKRNQILILLGAGAVILLIVLLAMMHRSRLQTRLNRKLARSHREVELEKERSEDLLLNILPAETARELKETGSAQTHFYPEVSVLFTDFKGFSKLAEQLSYKELVQELDECFRGFDEIVDRHGLEKIKTIGDAYMCASGLPKPNANHAINAVRAGMEIQQFMNQLKARRQAEGKAFFEARLGIHTGPVVAGVVGTHKFAYDIWGDTVNTASRLESSGSVGRVNISGATYEKVQSHFICQYRGAVSAKNIGEIDMYFVEWEI